MINSSLFSWLWPADRLGCSPGDPRYFTHVGRVVSSMRMGTPDSRTLAQVPYAHLSANTDAAPMTMLRFCERVGEVMDCRSPTTCEFR